MPFPSVRVIGGGLAGVEAAHLLARSGVPVELFEMRPKVTTPAHKTGMLAELVCSNSFKGTDPATAHGILKREMVSLGSLVLSAAGQSRVPAGKALAVDRETFSDIIIGQVDAQKLITLRREEVKEIDPDQPTIIATGPLTSDTLARNLAAMTGSERLFFYDAISPIIDAESIDMDHAFSGARWSDDCSDYLNCPLDEVCYKRFVNEVLEADKVRAHEFEDARFFEACLPIEIMAARGQDALRYGPMRPVGLKDPSTGKRPYAVVQLRKENLIGNAYTMVGFQTRLTFPEQKRVIGMIPAFSSAGFLRYGSIHRNTYLDSPRILQPDLQLIGYENIYLSGQITGVEGYTESAAMGIMAGISMLVRLKGGHLTSPGPETAIGALIRYITDGTINNFQPMNANFGIMSMPDAPKAVRNEMRSQTALLAFEEWKKSIAVTIKCDYPAPLQHIHTDIPDWKP
ncbi:MAG TPA: methylenetetrahydrofolate--tRNA-(uracil(54)-C(5))-methyltransferase (FADH(2)-oxidizing) TrmFO [Desulfomonilia bacterium]|nr:methylenetetrahydrofolate--tRNA-(uracil(54)-C(5))-methyltransferase (FADH(2)-oxidizing) TrmFO [Desulfomonilia bacterium]